MFIAAMRCSLVNGVAILGTISQIKLVVRYCVQPLSHKTASDDPTTNKSTRITKYNCI